MADWILQTRNLPTSRVVPASGPLIPPHTLQQRLTPVLFEASRLLSVVPAVFGALYNVYHVVYPPAEGRVRRVDYFVSLVWVRFPRSPPALSRADRPAQCILTGIQCLHLTTGLLVRWRAYYPPLPTLIRLLALQAICWPATHFTLTLLDHALRPVVCWAVVGTTTCCSRAVQMWVTSNLVVPVQHHHHQEGGGQSGRGGSRRGSRSGSRMDVAGVGVAQKDGEATPRRSGRRWDWGEVTRRCVLPMGVCYFVMAWAEVGRREWEGC